MGIGQDALMLHMDGYNCAQAVLASAGKLTGLDEAEALAMAAGFMTATWYRQLYVMTVHPSLLSV